MQHRLRRVPLTIVLRDKPSAAMLRGGRVAMVLRRGAVAIILRLGPVVMIAPPHLALTLGRGDLEPGNPRPVQRAPPGNEFLQRQPVAQQHGFVYGLITSFMALMTGWMASIVFRKD